MLMVNFRYENSQVLGLYNKAYWFLTISKFNDCNYCVASHHMIAQHHAKRPFKLIHQVLKGEKIDDKTLNALITLTSVTLNNKGKVTSEALESFLKQGYTECKF
jgi:alkylhydroperoxidase family enzyme